MTAPFKEYGYIKSGITIHLITEISVASFNALFVHLSNQSSVLLAEGAAKYGEPASTLKLIFVVLNFTLNIN